MAVRDEDQLLSAVPFTCRITAGFRAIELTRAKDPIIVDRLASDLAGSKALTHAVEEWERLEKLQGLGKHLRVPARSRIMDDRIIELLSNYMRTGQNAAHVQVVCLGAGMDSRPWRLEFPCDVNYFEVDQPEVQHLKEPLLLAAGAQVHHDTDSQGTKTDGNTVVNTDGNPAITKQDTAAFKFPLKCCNWASVGHDLSQPGLLEKLQAKGFDSSRLTIWVAEAVIYYLRLPQAVELVQMLAAASLQGSWFVLTCIDKDLYDGHLALENHVFAKLWHFNVDQLVPEMEAVGFRVVDPPENTLQLSRRLYQADLYTPEYGGGETLFCCCLGSTGS